MTMCLKLRRSKKFACLARYAELLVVADESMVTFPGDDLKHCLLTLMLVVASQH